MPTAFHSLQFGKGNKIADWVACGDSESLSCCPCESAPSSPATGWSPADGIVSGSPRCPFLLKPNGRLFHPLRYTPRNEAVLLVFDRQFELSNLASTRLLAAFPDSRRGADPVFIFFGDQNGIFEGAVTVREVAGLLVIRMTTG